MDYRLVFQISAAGMNLEKRRVDVAALNLANMHATAPAGQSAYLPQKVTAPALHVDFASALSAAALERPVNVVQMQLPPRLAHDPGHPHANAQGFVAYPAVDHTGEMLGVVTAMRAYEANVAVAASAKAMAARALDIGGQS
jgi:flagellar basal-body rod protein FlgC